MGDHDLVAVDANPHRLISQGVRDRVGHAAEADRGAPRDFPGLPEHRRVRGLGQRVQPMPFLGEHLDWCPPGHPMLAAVDLGHPRLTGLDQLGPAGVVAAQVGVGGHQVGLGDPHRRLADPPLDSGSAGTHVATVIP